MPGAMQTGFISRGDLSSTQLFAHAVSPEGVAKAGYEGMIEGKLNITAGLTVAQKPFMKLAQCYLRRCSWIMFIRCKNKVVESNQLIL